MHAIVFAFHSEVAAKHLLGIGSAFKGANLMSKITLSVFLIFFTASTAAAGENSASVGRKTDWNKYFQALNGDLYFFDASQVEKTDNLVRVWSGIQYKTSIMGASSFSSLLEIDCFELTERVLQSTLFTDKRWEKPVMATNTNEKPKPEILAGSAAQALAHDLWCWFVVRG